MNSFAFIRFALAVAQPKRNTVYYGGEWRRDLRRNAATIRVHFGFLPLGRYSLSSLPQCPPIFPSSRTK